jgi:hypothetical protein
VKTPSGTKVVQIRLPSGTRRLLPIPVSILVVVPVVLVVAGIYWFYAFDTVYVTILNDTPKEVETTYCGSDVPTIKAGGTAKIDLDPNDPHAACLVIDEHGKYSGCLLVPTTTDQRQFRVSDLKRDVNASACGTRR